jgi:hypothetical protein
MSFIPLYSVVGQFVFFVSLLLMVWGGLILVVTIFLRVAIIMRYRGCGVCVLTVFWSTLFQLAVSPFNWNDKVMEDVGKNVGKILDEEAAQDHEKESQDKPNLEGLKKKYPWGLSSHKEEGPVTSSEKAGLNDTTSYSRARTPGCRRRRHQQGECSRTKKTKIVDVVIVI